MCSRKRWKEEVQLKNFSLGYDEPRHFVQFERGWPKVYVGWRTFWMVYHVTWLFVSGIMRLRRTSSKANEIRWFIYLTDWTYSMLTLAALLDCVVVVYIHVARADILQGLTKDITWYQKTMWVFFNIANCGNVVVSILYWALLYSDAIVINAVNFGTHALNSVYVFANLAVSGTPMRLYHVVHTMLYSFVYAVFSVVYQKLGGTNSVDKPYIYAILDWDTAPVTALVYSIVIMVVAVPVIHFSLFLLYMLRVAVFDVVLNRQTQQTKSELKMDEMGKI